jgi:hypothetical protein
VEGIAAGELFGWVVDPEQSEASLEVEAFFDGAPLGRAVADLFRLDVDRAGFGPAHGFRFALSSRPAPGEHSVEVRTVEGRITVPIVESYVVVDDRGDPLHGVALRPASRAVARPLAAPREALLGRDGWLFEWTGETTFDVLRGAEDLAPETVAAHLDRLRAREAAVRGGGASLVEALVPAKLAVYPDQLPAGLPVVAARRPAELLAAVVREENISEVVDLEAPLRQARDHGVVFTRTGRGLTWTGAFAAYRALAKRLATASPEVVPLLRDGLKLGALELVADSLAELPTLGWTGTGTFPAVLAEGEDQEGEPGLDWTALSVEYAVIGTELAELAGPEAALLQRRPAEDAPAAGVLPAALVLHDGSAPRIAAFLAEHFERTLLVGVDAPVERLLEQFAPAVVFEIVSEQALLAA